MNTKTTDTTGINLSPEQMAQGVQALENNLISHTSLEARRRKSDKLKAGAIGTAKAVGYMAVGVGLTIGVQQFQARRQQGNGNNQQGGNQQGQ